MVNPLSFFSNLIKSSNQRELDRINKVVLKINALEEDIKTLEDTNFPKKLRSLKKGLKKERV